jgi:hypothetical protein
MNTAECFMVTAGRLDRIGDSMTSGPTDASLGLLRKLMQDAAELFAAACLEVAEKARRDACRDAGRMP